MIKLAPCPFCGNELSVYNRKYNPYARCETVNCKGSQLPILNLDDPFDILKWNNRASGWINIEDRLPSSGEWVLFLDGSKTMGHHPPFHHIDKINNRNECLVNYLHNYTHWIPLPDLLDSTKDTPE